MMCEVNLENIVEWFCSGDTGMSSEAIVSHMVRGKVGRYIFSPSDPTDLGRCLRLLERFPEWKPRIAEMSIYSPSWKALTDHWQELTNLMDKEVGNKWYIGRPAPLTYKRMEQIFNEANQ